MNVTLVAIFKPKRWICFWNFLTTLRQVNERNNSISKRIGRVKCKEIKVKLFKIFREKSLLQSESFFCSPRQPYTTTSCKIVFPYTWLWNTCIPRTVVPRKIGSLAVLLQNPFWENKMYYGKCAIAIFEMHFSFASFFFFNFSWERLKVQTE